MSDVKRYFHCYESFLRYLNAIESKLSISIPPILLNDLPREEQQDIDELYLLLCEKKVVRLNAKLTSTDSMSVDMKYCCPFLRGLISSHSLYRVLRAA